MNENTSRVPEAAPEQAIPALTCPHACRTSDAGRGSDVPLLETYLLGIGEMAEAAALSSLRVGDRLPLRRGRAGSGRGALRRVEVQGPNGRALGYLPPEDAGSVTAVLEAGAAASARITAVVPAFRRQRVLLEIQVGAAATVAAEGV